jgi:hypothetical protein
MQQGKNMNYYYLLSCLFFITHFSFCSDITTDMQHALPSNQNELISNSISGPETSDLAGSARSMQDEYINSDNISENTDLSNQESQDHEQIRDDSACPVMCPCPEPIICAPVCPRRICRPQICKKARVYPRRCLPECRPICAPLPRPTYCPEPLPVNCPPPRPRCCKVRRYCCPRPVKHCPAAVYCSPVPSVCPMPHAVCPASHPGYCYKPPVCQPICASKDNLITYAYQEHPFRPNVRVLAAKEVSSPADRTGISVIVPVPKNKIADENADSDQFDNTIKAGPVSELPA